VRQLASQGRQLPVDAMKRYLSEWGPEELVISSVIFNDYLSLEQLVQFVAVPKQLAQPGSHWRQLPLDDGRYLISKPTVYS